MSEESSARLGLPLLQVGQAQKELTHNEALTLLDIAVQPVVEAVGLTQPPGAPDVGACWIVGTNPAGAWSGQAHAIAGWTEGGWRFLPARVGMAAWSRADGALATFDGSAWAIGTIAGARLVLGGQQVVGERQPGIALATGGATIDVEARATLAAVLAALHAHGLVAT